MQAYQGQRLQQQSGDIHCLQPTLNRLILTLLLAGVMGTPLLSCQSAQAQKNEMPPRVTGTRASEAATRLEYLIEGETAIRLMPSAMVTGQGMTQAEWSPDGRFVLAVRIPTALQPTDTVPVSLALWNKKTRRSVDLWNHRLSAPVLAGPTRWLANGHVGIVSWRWMEADENGNWGIKEGMVWVDAARGVAHEIDAQPGDQLFVSSQGSGAVLNGHPPFLLQSLRVIAPDGSLSPMVPLPEGVRGYHQARWQADGKQFFLELDVVVPAQEKKEDAKPHDQSFAGPIRKQWFAVDMALARVSPLDKEPVGVPALPGDMPPKPLSKAGESSLRVSAAPTILRQRRTETQIHSLWLETGGNTPMAALLCADGTQARIAPAGDAVLYLAQTGVWVTPLARMPRAVFMTSVLTPHQDDVKYRAWTLAQGVRMWRETHQGGLPVPEDAVAALQSLMPAELLYEGFRYVWKGGALPAQALSAETVIAEIAGPGGYAQIFADGHSVWKSAE